MNDKYAIVDHVLVETLMQILIELLPQLKGQSQTSPLQTTEPLNEPLDRSKKPTIVLNRRES